MPERSDKVERLYEEAADYELPYVSKSRVKQWLDNPEHFRLKYLEELKEEETMAMRRGSDIHEIFEAYYEEAQRLEYYPGDNLDAAIPDDYMKWADYTEPYISNFLVWEHSRWQETDKQNKYYQPVAIEEEHWRDPILGIDGEPEWMGLADVILPAASLPEFGDDGVVVVDFKTGSVPKEEYRSPGIYTELEYYVVLFENKYDVVGAGAYYPRADTFLKQPDDDEHREDVYEAVASMVMATEDYDGDNKFAINPGPLCKWGEDDDKESSFYGLCTQCTWGVPAKKRNTFETLVEEGYTDTEIAQYLGCETDEVNYWKYKFDL